MTYKIGEEEESTFVTLEGILFDQIVDTDTFVEGECNLPDNDILAIVRLKVGGKTEVEWDGHGKTIIERMN